MTKYHFNKPKNTTIPLSEIKEYTRIDTTDDDSLVTNLSSYAEYCIAEQTGIVVSSTTVELKDITIVGNSIPLSVRPIESIIEVNSGGIKLDNKQYNLKNNAINLLTEVDPTNLSATLQCGYIDPTQIDANLYMIVMDIVAFTYQNRGTNDTYIKSKINSMIAPIRTVQI